MSLYVGAISGTSIDGLDLSVVDISDQIRILHCETAKFPDDLHRALQALARQGAHEISRIGTAHVQLGVFIGESILRFLKNCGIDCDHIRAIGNHGQTICHQPSAEYPFSMQIGDGSSIAEITGRTTICDFRSRDLAAGGEGAPLVPLFHRALFPRELGSIVVLNIGGIANISTLSSSETSDISGYDTGPGNALLDAWILEHQKVQFDKDGKWSRSGRVDNKLLADFLANPYFARSGPKSTGKELFNLQFIHQHLASHKPIAANDVQATLLELTCRTISESIGRINPNKLIVCGGGRLNPHIMDRIRQLLAESKTSVVVAEDVGVNGDGLEAATFAYLAWALLEGKPGNVREVTGARGKRLLGCIYPGNSWISPGVGETHHRDVNTTH